MISDNKQALELIQKIKDRNKAILERKKDKQRTQELNSFYSQIGMITI